MKTFTEFKEYLQEKKAKGKSEYKKSELDDQINQAIEDAKSDGNNEDLNKLEAIRTEKDPDVKKSRFDVFMRQKDEDNSQDDAQDDPDADSVQEEKEANDSNDPDVKKVKDCEQMTPRQKKIKMERLRDRK